MTKHTSPDGTKRIYVYGDRKIRFGFYEEGRDYWQVLWRTQVPNLTDEEWFRAPTAEWKSEHFPGIEYHEPMGAE
jgi:hypothetical protein